MNFNNSEFLLLVVAFLVGYFFQEMMKRCQVMEGLKEEVEEELKEVVDKVEEEVGEELKEVVDKVEEEVEEVVYPTCIEKDEKCQKPTPGNPWGGCGEGLKCCFYRPDQYHNLDNKKSRWQCAHAGIFDGCKPEETWDPAMKAPRNCSTTTCARVL